MTLAISEDRESERALKAAYAILAADAAEGRVDLRQRIDVEDEAGNIIHTVQFRDIVAITGHASS